MAAEVFYIWLIVKGTLSASQSVKAIHSVILKIGRHLGRGRVLVCSCFLLEVADSFSYDAHLHIIAGGVNYLQFVRTSQHSEPRTVSAGILPWRTLLRRALLSRRQSSRREGEVAIAFFPSQWISVRR